MVGISHVAFRELIRSYLPVGIQSLLFTEMLSTRRIPSERLDDAISLRCAPGETGFIPQLLGNEEKFIAPSIAKLMQQGPWGFDINMGCPTSHTLRHNWGVLLVGDRAYASEVVRITKRHTSLPVSVKLRAGQGESATAPYLKEFTASLEDAGADWITLHCRSQAQGHKGAANWQLVAEVAAARKIPVVANGDIQTWKDALHLVNEFGVDGAMIGRAATARPWILWQIAHALGHPNGPADRMAEKPPLTPEDESREYRVACTRYIDLLEKYFGDSPFALKKFHFFVVQGSRWFLFGHNFWKSTMRAKTLAQAREIVWDYLDKNSHPISERIEFN